jgi:hypothetical protein
MGLELIPEHLRQRYRFDEREHACAILASDFPDEFTDILDCLDDFRLRRSYIATPGGSRSQISVTIDRFLWERGWREKSFRIDIKIDEQSVPIPTNKIDNFKNRVGVEVEWNNKTEFYDRDLNNFRLLRELRVLSVGVIITRLTELQVIFNRLGRGSSYGNSSTHWDKLIPKVNGGGAGGCPLLLIGLGVNCYTLRGFR